MGIVYWFTFFNEFWLLYSCYAGLFTSYNISLVNVAYLFATSQIAKIIFDIIFGFFLNNINRKIIFSFACICRVIMLFLWISIPSELTFFIGMALIGIHMSCFFQHYEGYLYDINANKYRFSRILGKYYAIMSTSILCASFILNIQDIISYQYILSFQCFISIIATFMIFLTPNSTIKITNNSIFRVTHIIKSHTMFYILLLAIIEGLFMSSANMISILAEHYSQTVNISAKLMIVITAIKIPLNYISGRLKIKHPLIINQLAVLISLPFFYLGGEFGIIGLILYFIFYAIGTIHIYSVVHANIIPNDRMIAASVITIFISIFTICFDLNIGWLGVRNGIIANSIMSILFCHIVYKMQNHSLKNILHRVT